MNTEMSDELRAIIAALPSEQGRVFATPCPDCEAHGNARQGWRTGKWFAAHIGCGRPTIIGDSEREVAVLWETQ